VYLAIRDAIAPALRRQPKARVLVDDKGDHWAAYSSVPVKTENGHLVVVMGGGGLGLDIDKCTGAVSHAAYQR
jgi:hypothetical protein